MEELPVKIRVFDTESTGIPSETEKHSAVEFGWTDFDIATGRISEPKAVIVNPHRPIPVEAMAIHHIRNSDVENAPAIERACMTMMDGAEMFGAFNMAFDEQFFGGGGKPMLCAYKAALRIWPDCPSHKNQVLRYYLDLDDAVDFDPDLAVPPHRSGPDSYVTAHLFRRILKETTIEQIIRWSSGPALLANVRFGKHFGEKWSQVDKSYLSWILEKSDIKDRDIRATAKYYLTRKEQ
jgi:exodeoxyribonuclease X